MYSRLKKRRNKIGDQTKVNPRQRSGYFNFPSIVKKKDSEDLGFNKSRGNQRKRAYFYSNKKLEKTSSVYKSISFSGLGPLQTRHSKIMKLNLKVNAIPHLSISTKNWCLYDSKQKKYLGFRHDYQREIASLTKIMTTFLTLELIQSFQLSLSCKVKVSQIAASMIGTSAQLPKNSWITIEDLLYGTMLPSGNDAAYTLAEYMGYLIVTYGKSAEQLINAKGIDSLDITSKNTVFYVQQFILQMNQKAKQIRLFNTRFSNPHGLQNAMNVSTAKDIILLSVTASSNEKFKNVMNCVYWKYTIYETEDFRKNVTKKWWNTNKLLYKNWQGIKTGHTSAAGCCLSSLRKGVYIVVLNSDNLQTRFSDTQYIYEWYMNNGNKKECFQGIEAQLKGTYRFKTQFSCVQSPTTTDSL